MQDYEVLEHLLDLAEKLGIEVRQVRAAGTLGGICRIKKGRVLFVDEDAGLADQIERTAQSLAELEEIDNVYILPKIREILEQNKA